MCGCQGGVCGCGECMVRGHAWFQGGMHAGGRVWLGACMVSGGHVWLRWGVCVVVGGVHGFAESCVVVGGHVWLREGACMIAGGMSGFWGACVAAGGVHGCGGLHGCWGACIVARGVHRIRRDTVNERVVRILLECILVSICFSKKNRNI